MSTVIQREAVVGPDGNILVDAHELAPGQRVTVTIQPEEATPLVPDAYPAEGDIPMIDLIEEDPGQQLFKTAEEVDEYLRQERDAWDR